MSSDSTILMTKMGLKIEEKPESFSEKKSSQLNPPNLASEKTLSMENILKQCINKPSSNPIPRS